MKKSKFLLLCLFCSLTSCMIFRAGDVEYEKLKSEHVDPNKTAALYVYGFDTLNGLQSQMAIGRASGFSQLINRMYLQSGLFKDVERVMSEADLNSSKSDLKFEVVVRTNEDSSQLHLALSGGSLMLIPYWARSKFTVETVVKDRSGRELGDYSFSDSTVFYAQLFLLFGLPFSDDRTDSVSIVEDLTRAVLQELIDANLL